MEALSSQFLAFPSAQTPGTPPARLENLAAQLALLQAPAELPGDSGDQQVPGQLLLAAQGVVPAHRLR